MITLYYKGKNLVLLSLHIMILTEITELEYQFKIRKSIHFKSVKAL